MRRAQRISARGTHRSEPKASRYRRTLRDTLYALGIASVVIAGSGWSLELPDEIPPFLSEGVAPNLVLTIDDSTSMADGDAPDLAAPRPGRVAYWSSPDVNKLYFDPAKAYAPGLTAHGDELDWPTDFTAVTRYPYRIASDQTTDCGETIDLTTDFDPVVREYVDGETCHVQTVGDPGRAYYHSFEGDNGYKVTTDGDYIACAVSEAGCTGCGDDHGPVGDDQTPDICFERHEITDDETMRRFATWYSYYRTRMLSAQTIVSRVMQTLDDDVRLTYQGLEARLDLMPDAPAFQRLVENFAPFYENRSDFYDWLYGLSPMQVTYLTAAQVRAGELVSRGVSRADDIAAHKDSFGDKESGDDEPISSNACGVYCRHNFHLMLTDGYWEDSWGTNDEFTEYWPKTNTDPSGKWIEVNQDNQPYDLPEGPFGILGYDPSSAETRIFADDNTGMLADAAFYYWVRDLDGDSSNNQVEPLISEIADGSNRYDRVNFWKPGNDPAHWQHLTLVTVSFGVEGAVERKEAPDFGEYKTGDQETTTLAADGFPDCFAEPPYPPYLAPDGTEYPLSVFSDRYGGCTAVNSGWDSWPSAVLPSESKIDDLYHAGINGRGGYYDAANPHDLLESFAEILNTISSGAEQEAASVPVAVSAGGLSESSRIYQAVTDTEHWAGALRVFRVSSGYGVGNCPTKPRGAFCEEPDAPFQTTAADGSFPDPDARTIFTMANGTPADFDRGTLFAALSADQQRGLMGCVTTDDLGGDCMSPGELDSNNANREIAEARIDWLRGDDTPIVDSTVVASPPTFRERESLLGDILGGGPLVVGSPRQLFSGSDYTEFKKITRSSIVYVGANDGMLHAFDADSTPPKLVETFAYVPGAIYANLADLTDPAYGGSDPSKKAFVDGPLTYSDANFTGLDGISGWRSVLVGALGMGAQGIYALDITDPTASRPSDVVLWEFTDASGSDEDDGALDGRDMGYNLAAPAIVRIDHDNNDATDAIWVVLVGNGYGNTSTYGEDPGACSDADDATNCRISQTGDAVLYVLQIGGSERTRILARMDTGVGKDTDKEDGGNPSGLGFTNGLMKVSTLDEDGDLIADRAYAGDLFGNVWRFDLKHLTEPPLRIFQALDDSGNVQPITARIAFTDHPNGGYMLLFGTGRLVNVGDKEDVETQTFYGIWDDNGLVHPAAMGGFVRPTRGSLLQQAFVQTTNVKNADGASVTRGRTSTQDPVYRPEGAVRGWRIDLEMPGVVAGTDCKGSERVVVDPQLRRGRVVFVSTIPESVCSSGGTSWINALDALDGSRLAFTAFDYTLDGNFDSEDLLDTDDDPSSKGEVGSSIRVLTDNGTGIYSAPSPLGLGGGQTMSIIADSEGDLIQLEESNAHGWRTWLQLD